MSDNNELKKNKKIGKIILIIAFILIFLLIGFFYGRILFIPKNNNTSNEPQALADFNNSKENNNDNTNNTASMVSNYINTFNGKKIFFYVQDTLKEDVDYSDETRKCIKRAENDNSELSIWIEAQYGTIDEYMTDLKNDANRKKDNTDYSNIEFSNTKELTKDERKFSYRTYNYNIGNIELNNLYIVSQLEDNLMYVIEIEEYESLTSDELDGLLTINIEK